jgi:SAM-dependent methyltransferase
MSDERRTDFREVLQKVIDNIFDDNIEVLIRALTDPTLTWLSEQLGSARHSPDLIRELLRLWIMQPNDENDAQVAAARKYFGWNAAAKNFNGIKPEFLDVIYLLPPRSYALIETLIPLLEHQLIEPPMQPKGMEIKTLFDIGTGTGLLIQILIEAGITGEMLGIEPASSLAGYASSRFKKPSGVQIAVKEIQNFDQPPASPQFQMALCYMVLHHVSDAEYERALRRIFRSLADGGLFVYTDKLCADINDENEPQAFDFTTAPVTLTLESGQEFDVQSAELSSVRPFQPHPPLIDEYLRPLKTAAEKLSKTGFLIQTAKPLNERVMMFVCRKPHAQVWINFAEMPTPEFRVALGKESQLTFDEGKPPYYWTYDILRAFYKDITREECPRKFKRDDTGFLRGIAYFSWEKASRLFLVRRAVPFDFHILSYSHVHDGWGSLGRMVEEFEKNTVKYVEEIGYSCLTRDAVQRTLPFQGDIEQLNYEAAMAVPIYNHSEISGYQLRGAFLLYLAKPEYVPIHTGISWERQLVEKFQDLNNLMNAALNQQDKTLEIVDSSSTTCAKWEKLAKERPDVVIARLEIKIKIIDTEDIAGASLGLLKVCSNIQALLSGGECFSVLDDRSIKNGKATILVAARYLISYDEIRENILTAVGTAAEDYGPLFYKCTRLGLEPPMD